MATRRTGQARRYMVAEVLHAIARMLTAPRPGGIGLPRPREIIGLDPLGTPGPNDPLARVTLTSSLLGVRAVRRWADALNPLLSITVEASVAGSAVWVRVVGRIPRGPVIEVSDWLPGLPLAEPLPTDGKPVPVTLDELHALDEAEQAGRFAQALTARGTS